MAKARKNNTPRQVAKSTKPDLRRERATKSAGEVRHLPQYRLLLHNDDVNDRDRVVLVVCKVTPLPFRTAIDRMLEAHRHGIAQLLVTHKELAELYVERMLSYGLTATMEPVE